MKTYTCDWQETDGGLPGPLLGWYYVTQAMYHSTDDPRESEYWKYWNPLFSTTLLNHQQDDGRWEFPESEGGQREKAQFDGRNRILYSTAMCCLTLEVYYRYLPTYRPPDDRKEEDDNGVVLGFEDGREQESLARFVVTLEGGKLGVNGQPMNREDFLRQLATLEERNPRSVRVEVCWFQEPERDDVISLVRALMKAHVFVTVVPPPELADIEPEDQIF
jgi:hypothetical protein